MAVEDNAPNRDAKPTTGKAPDLDAATATAWPQREFPIRDPESGRVVQVVLKQSVLDAIHEHGQSRTDVEVCGVMVGQCYQDQRGPFVYVEEIIRGNHSESQTAQVTFTAETWNHIQNEMDRRFEDQRILGWYHTHPGFGIFLSPMDLFIHENFFGANEQLAFVYDPLGGDEGLFIWRNGQAVRDHYLVEADPASRANGTRAVPPLPATAAASPPDMESIDKRIRRLERRQGLLTLVVCLMVLLAVFWSMISHLLNTLTKPPSPGDRMEVPVYVQPIPTYQPPQQDHEPAPAPDEPEEPDQPDEPEMTPETPPAEPNSHEDTVEDAMPTAEPPEIPETEPEAAPDPAPEPVTVTEPAKPAVDESPPTPPSPHEPESPSAAHSSD